MTFGQSEVDPSYFLFLKLANVTSEQFLYLVNNLKGTLYFTKLSPVLCCYACSLSFERNCPVQSVPYRSVLYHGPIQRWSGSLFTQILPMQTRSWPLRNLMIFLKNFNIIWFLNKWKKIEFLKKIWKIYFPNFIIFLVLLRFSQFVKIK
jgi:hypothetical protein